MDASNEEETTVLIPDSSISTTIQDIRRSHEKYLAVYLILASILLEDAAFYSLELNISSGLSSNATFSWADKHSSTIADIFDGKYYWTSSISVTWI